MGYLHQVVVYHHSQVIGRHTVALQQHFIVHQIGIKGYIPAYHILEYNGLVLWHFYPDHVVGAIGQQLCYFIGWQRQRIAHFHAGSMVILNITVLVHFQVPAHAFQIFRGVKCIVCIAGIDQLFGILVIEVFSLALPVWGIGAALCRTFIRCKAAPLQAFCYIVLCSSHKSGLVGIFNTQHEVAAVCAGKQVIK